MDPSIEQKIKQSPSRKRLFIRVLIIVGCFLVVTGGVTAGLYLWHHQTLVNEVKSDLKQVPPLMEAARKGGNGYPTTITANQLPKDNNVTFVGIGSFDGTTYCVTGTSKKDSSIVYHIDSASSAKDPQPKSCTDATNLPAPATPSGLSIAATGVDQVSTTWSATPFASSYTLQCATDTDFKVSVVEKTVQATSGVCSGLKSSTLYHVRVRANNTSKPSGWSSVITAKTDVMSVAPSEFTGDRLSKSSVKYSWNSVSGATAYIVERADDINFMKNVVSKTVPATQTSMTFDGLLPGTAYFFHVKAVTATFSASEAAFSNETQIRTLE